MLIFSFGRGYSENQFLFPKEKPSIFKKIETDDRKNYSSNLPQKKPLVKKKEVLKEEIIQKLSLTKMMITQ